MNLKMWSTNISKTLIAILCFLSGLSPVAGEEPAPKGVIFYRSAPGETDVLARVQKFTSIEIFTNVTHFVLENGEKNRVFQNNLIGVIEFPNMTSASISTSQQIEEFNGMIQKIKGAIDRYPGAYHEINDDLLRFSAAQQMIQQGNVLIGGQWKSGAEHEMTAPSGPVFVPELLTGDQKLLNARLSGIDGSKVRILHSGGVTSAVIADLSDEVIAKLNRTSEDLQIVKRTAPEEMDEATKSSISKKILGDLDAGVIIDLEGNRYMNVKVNTVEDDAIAISHSRGSAKLSFDVLPQPLKIKFGYDPVAAAAAKKVNEEKQAALRVKAMADAAAAAEDRRRKAEMARLLDSAEKIQFRITQVIDEGLLIWNLTDSKTELLKVDSDQFDVADGEIYSAWVISSGTFEYESILGVGKRVRAWKFIPTK